MRIISTRLDGWKNAFDADSRQWGLTYRTALGLALAPVVLVGIVAVLAMLAVVAKSAFRPAFTLVTAEDSLLEWPQFFFVLASSPIFACTGVLLMRRGQRAIGLFYLLIAVGAFLVAGEEISWGQRVFGWAHRKVWPRLTIRPRRTSTTFGQCSGPSAMASCSVACTAF